MRPLDPVAEALLGFESDAELVAMIDAVYRVLLCPHPPPTPTPRTHKLFHSQEESHDRRRLPGAALSPAHKSSSL